MQHGTDIETLKRAELFRGMPEDLLREIRAVAFRKHAAEGETVYRQGDAAATFFVVASGRLRVAQTTYEGQQVIIRYLGPGEMVGYAALTGEDAHPATVIAVDATDLIGWQRSNIQSIMAKYPAVALNAVAVLGTRYQEIQLRLRELSTEDVERRIAHTLLRLAQQAGRRTGLGIEIAFPISRQELGDMAGTTLHTASRILSTWEERGIVASGRRRVVVCKVPELEAIAGEPS